MSPLPFAKRTTTEKRDYVRHGRPDGFSLAQGCGLMALPAIDLLRCPCIRGLGPGDRRCHPFDLRRRRELRLSSRRRGASSSGPGRQWHEGPQADARA